MMFPLVSTMKVCRESEVRGQQFNWCVSDAFMLTELGLNCRSSRCWFSKERDLLWLVEGIQILQWGVAKFGGWIPVDKWKGFSSLEVNSWFLCYLSDRQPRRTKVKVGDKNLKTLSFSVWPIFCDAFTALLSAAGQDSPSGRFLWR